MRIKLSEKYSNKREEVCSKIISMIYLDENKSFLLCDLDNDIEKQQKILVLLYHLSNLTLNVNDLIWLSLFEYYC
jgi:hypothetical protein